MTSKRILMTLCVTLLVSALVPASAAQAVSCWQFGFTTKWGGYGLGNGQFQGPAGIATDGAGNVYVVDMYNRVQKFGASGSYLTQWGSFGSGNGQFKSPWGVATDANGNVYVTDTAHDRIVKFNRDGAFVRSWGSSRQ